MEKLNCFFFVEGSEEQENQIIRASCVECMKDKKIPHSMFWPGSEKGYGPFKYSCIFCNKIIYAHEAK